MIVPIKIIILKINSKKRMKKIIRLENKIGNIYCKSVKRKRKEKEKINRILEKKKKINNKFTDYLEKELGWATESIETLKERKKSNEINILHTKNE